MPLSARDTMFDVKTQKPVIDLQGDTYQKITCHQGWHECLILPVTRKSNETCLYEESKGLIKYRCFKDFKLLIHCHIITSGTKTALDVSFWLSSQVTFILYSALFNTD